MHCKIEEGQSVSSYVLKMKSYIDKLERIGHPMPHVLVVNTVPGYGIYIFNNVHGMKSGKRLEKGAMMIHMGNGNLKLKQ
ncbi:hypothetical protein Tco_0167487 [Tanacetum coccineum]